MTREEQMLDYITGEYKNLGEFARKHNISYNYLRSYGRTWNERKRKYIEQKREAVCGAAIKNTEEEILSRNNATLDVCRKIREKANAIISGVKSGKELNAMASAMYRVNEVELKILTGQKTGNDSKDELDELIKAIEGACDE